MKALKLRGKFSYHVKGKKMPRVLVVFEVCLLDASFYSDGPSSRMLNGFIFIFVPSLRMNMQKRAWHLSKLGTFPRANQKK